MAAGLDTLREKAKNGLIDAKPDYAGIVYFDHDTYLNLWKREFMVRYDTAARESDIERENLKKAKAAQKSYLAQLLNYVGIAAQSTVLELQAEYEALRADQARAHRESTEQRLAGNPRNNVDRAADDLNERLLKTQIYKHIEMLIAFRMAAPLTLTGIMMFIIEASLGDVNFQSEEVQTTLAIGVFGSFAGVLGAAYFIKYILHKDWEMAPAK